MSYAIDGCPLNTKLYVIVDLSGPLQGLTASQVAGPRPATRWPSSAAWGADGYVAIEATMFISAYVLLYEPRPEPLPPGNPGRRLRREHMTYFPSGLRNPEE